MPSRKLRRGQLTQSFGVGALIESEGESFIVKDISSWSLSDMEKIDTSSFLGMLPPQARELYQIRQDRWVPVSRFPRWLFCPRCRSLTNWKYNRDEEKKGGEPRCSNRSCRGVQLVPMRFVRVCGNGHIDDIDWYSVAHDQTDRCERNSAQLRFVTKGGDFSSMWIECNCGAKGNLEFIRKRTLPGKCRGSQPWQKPDSDACDEAMVAEPRGSSALHYGNLLSLLDISKEEESPDELAKFLADPRLKILLDMAQDEAIPDPLLEVIKKQLIPIQENHGLDSDTAWQAFLAQRAFLAQLDNDAKADAENGGDIDLPNIRGTALTQEFNIFSRNEEFKSKHLHIIPQSLEDDGETSFGHYFHKVSRVTRLREVRVFCGFCRREPENQTLSADLSGKKSWLPASEVIGEGIFLEFRRETVKRWLEDSGDKLSNWLHGRVKKAYQRGIQKEISKDGAPLFFMAHTFSHLLLRSLACECGYSSNSIRERIYFDEPEKSAGVLLYTADSDAEGSLGGLVEMGYLNRLKPIVMRALVASRWCSSDPVCRESVAQGLFGLNRAACHACCLVAETSCFCGNSLLDRVMLSGSGLIAGSTEPPGYFAPLLKFEVIVG